MSPQYALVHGSGQEARQEAIVFKCVLSDHLPGRLQLVPVERSLGYLSRKGKNTRACLILGRQDDVELWVTELAAASSIPVVGIAMRGREAVGTASSRAGHGSQVVAPRSTSEIPRSVTKALIRARRTARPCPKGPPRPYDGMLP